MNLLESIHQGLVQTAYSRFENRPGGIRKVLLLTYMSMIVILFSGVFGTYYHFQQMPAAAWICVYGGCSAALLLTWMFIFRQTAWAAHFFCMTTVIFFSLFTGITGGILSPFVPWLVTAPLVGSLMLKSWETWIWAGIALALLPVIYWFTPILPNPANWGFGGKEEAITLISHGGFLAFCLGIIMTLIQVRSDLARLERIKSAERAEDAAALKAMIAAKDSERQRIARELHDHIGAVITVVRLRHESMLALEKVQSQGASFFQHLEALGNRISKASQWFSLHVLRDFGLLKGLVHLGREFEHESGKSIELILPSESSPTMEQHAEQIYRIAQGILGFAANHATAETTSLQLLELDGKLRLMVDVHGLGLSALLADSEAWRMRLREIEDRARLMQADLLYETSEASGLTIIIETPTLHAAN